MKKFKYKGIEINRPINVSSNFCKLLIESSRNYNIDFDTILKAVSRISSGQYAAGMKANMGDKRDTDITKKIFPENNL